jgi:hypothetical protein
MKEVLPLSGKSGSTSVEKRQIEGSPTRHKTMSGCG